MDTIGFAIIAAQAESFRRKSILKIQRKMLRDACDPFDLDELIFQRNFRLNKSAFKYVLDELQNDFEPGVFSCSITPTCRLVAVLRFFAGGGYQLGVGNEYEVGKAQSTFSATLKNVLNILERRLCPVWIKIQMSEAEKSLAKRDFYLKLLELHICVRCKTKTLGLHSLFWQPQKCTDTTEGGPDAGNIKQTKTPKNK